MGNLNVMKYILFLFSILFFKVSLWADTATDLGTGIKVNLDNYKSDTFSDPYSLSTPTLNAMPSYSYDVASGTLKLGRVTCSPEHPEACVLVSQCFAAGGYWNAIDSNCGRAFCHLGTTQDSIDPTKCKCNDDAYAFVQRGNFLQSCPSQCFSSPNKSYSFMSKSCTCNEGFTMATNGDCNPIPAPRPPAPSVSDCWQELAEKALACETSANTAVSQCEPASEDSSLTALRGLLLSRSGGASENCERAATASTSGFYQTEDNRRSCDEGINSCKTGCADAKTFMNANKERLYNACRERAFQDQINEGPPLPPDRFNPMWDSQNRANLESQFQSLLARTETSRATCETGTAAKNREKLSTAMNEMNTASVNATKCVCQLNPNSNDCSTTPGPADCSSNPSLPGCVKVADNCFDPKNTSVKCICFRNPESMACKSNQPNFNIKASEIDTSSFAGAKRGLDTRSANTSTSGMAAGKNSETNTTSGISNAGENYLASGGNESGVAQPPAASGSAVSSLGNSAAGIPVAGPGASVSSGGGKGLVNKKNPTSAFNEDQGIRKKLGGFFDTAKSALGGIFKKGSNSGGSASGDYRDDSDGDSSDFDSKKYRPRMIVRGIASDEELAGKHEDIWKVMNKQYKVQDQKDNFIFDADKK